MNHQRLPRLILLAFAALLNTANAAAGRLDDPFETELITPPLMPPQTQLSPASGDQLDPCPAFSAQTTYGVLEVVNLALCRNPRTRESWANARAQAALVGAAQAAYLPGLDGRLASNYDWRSGGTSGRTSSRQNSASLTLSWLLYDFGARAASLENARQLLGAAASTLQSSVQNVFLSAVQSYYNAQAARAAVVAAQEAEKASRASLTAAEVRYRVGTGTPADRLQAQTAFSQATLNRIRSEGTLRSAIGTLANSMGLAASQALRLDDIPDNSPPASFERNVEALIEEAQSIRPDLRAAEAQVLAAEANIEATRAAGQPRLSLSTGPSWVDSGGITSHSGSIGLTLSLPIFSGFENTYRIRAAQARAEASSAQRDNLRLQVALDVWSSYQNLMTATQAIRSSTDLQASAEQSERVALGRYKAGVGTILDLLNAQSALAGARLQRIQAQLDWNVSRATLARAVGALDQRLLNPDVETLNQ